ncbi:M20 family metallopeptidase [Deinococcus metallilatus]|uniref:Succinyl-diaminopimelate desuccinylase n=2 Tax=Deinococcus metallilatus TaxID=1211322 RepID=A0ABR6MSP5_9DEIO|nr:M20/M25/M40 family metallo-hydrolase [Deinococcus metallilatus]MBB5294950.1 succinyl-diaminopimelate desuccinylase [Deinococcus metallilatus]GMA16881.1 acetylornithine deacetylase [Deinococcus metallilatus]
MSSPVSVSPSSHPEVLALRAAAAMDEAFLIDLAARLVAVDSQAPHPGEEVAARLLEEVLRAQGFQTTWQEVAPGRPNLIADWGEGEGGLILEGHTDVVASGDPALWRVPPFEGRVEGGVLHGRGSADMKGGVACAVAAAVAVSRVLPRSSRRLRLAILCDEEGLMLGVKAFVRGGYAAGFAGAIICEPEEHELCLWQKGALRIWLHFRGRMAHGAMPYAGLNPLPAAAQFVARLPEVQAAYAGERHPQLGDVYVTPTVMQASAGEGQNNVIPELCTVGLDVRTVPATDHAALQAALLRLAEECLDEGMQVTMNVFEDRPATETPPEAAVVQALARATELLGFPVRYGGVPGATDGTFLHAWAGLPIVTCGPGRRDIPHQIDEYVEVQDLIRAARTYAAAATLFLEREEDR